MWETETESVAGRDYADGIHGLSKHGVKTEGFELRGHSWYVATDVPSDLVVRIGDYSFHLHKYPLLSRSGKMNRIIYESRNLDLNRVVLDDLPGGPDAFELAAKFCYGIAVDLTASNISGLRCAAEYLEMTEDFEEGNLIFKTEAFLSYVVLSSWRDSIMVLKSCEKLSPWAENLQIVRRCSESIAWKACANPKGIRWAYTGRPPSVSSPKSSPSGNQQVPPDWWFEDVSILRIDHFVRVITAIKVKGMRFELIGAAIMHYAEKWLPGMTQDGTGTADGASNSSTSHSSGGSSWKGGLHMIVAGTKEELPTVQAKDQRMITESLISIIPPQKDCVSCSFLLRLLRMAGQKVLDVGCGIGGPLREIGRFSLASVTGLNNNEYQIARGEKLNRIAGVEKTCDFVKADFMNMPFSDNTFDAAYAIEATCHAPDIYGCYKEIYRVLKPGQYFLADEWCLTDSFDPNNKDHQKIKAEIELGNGLPCIRSSRQCLEAMKQAGFEVIWEKDLATDSPVPWYLPLDKNHFSLSNFRATAIGRFITKLMVRAFEGVGLAPKGSCKVQEFLEKAADGLFEGGRKEIFTTIHFFLVRKPHSEGR